MVKESPEFLPYFLIARETRAVCWSVQSPSYHHVVTVKMWVSDVKVSNVSTALSLFSVRLDKYFKELQFYIFYEYEITPTVHKCIVTSVRTEGLKEFNIYYGLKLQLV